MSKSTLYTFPTKSGFLMTSKTPDIETNIIMKLSLAEDGTVKSYPSNNGTEDRALLVSENGAHYAYITESILSNLDFDDSGFCNVEVVKFPTKVTPTKKFSLGAK